MRAIVFLASTLLSLFLFQLWTDAGFAFALLMSACIGAIVSTVATRSGRRAGGRISTGLCQGWGRSQT